MALLYRTIFTDERPHLIEDARELFAQWLASKGIELPVAAGDGAEDVVEVSEVEHTQDGIAARRMTLHEDRRGAGERWSTTMTVIDSSTERCVWIDLERVADDPFGLRPVLAPPRLVRAFLAGGTARIGPVPLLPAPIPIQDSDVPGLVELLLHRERTIPVLVVSRDRYCDAATNRARAEELARQVAGIAPVYVLEGYATTELSKALGSDLHVFNGAVRTYLPGMAVPDRNPRRHRFVGPSFFTRRTTDAAQTIARVLADQSEALRPPELYRETVSRFPGFPRSRGATDSSDLLDYALDENESLSRENAELKEERDEAGLELDYLLGRIDDQHARIRYLEGRLAERGEFVIGVPTPDSETPDTATSCAKVLELARNHLSYVVIGDTHDAAVVLDTHTKASAWARKAWQAVRALQSYAEWKGRDVEPFDGDFWSFCTAPPSGADTVAVSWLAMKESETVDNNPQYRAARTFPVPREVDPDGRVYMASHIKIEPGGRPAPRIHFHDDTSGRTGRIYVGYFGVHLPNDRTN